jgi:hypothetical protein
MRLTLGCRRGHLEFELRATQQTRPCPVVAAVPAWLKERIIRPSAIYQMSFLVSLIKPLVYISVPVFVLRRITSSSPVGRYYLNVGLYIGTLVAVSAWGAVLGIVMLVAGDRLNLGYYVAKSFYAAASRVLDIKVEVEGEEHLQTRPALLLANHQSMLDVLILTRWAFLNS